MYQLLIVDDEEDIRRGMARGIPWEEWGYCVAGQAENGEEAVRLAEETHPDVVLSDIRMPKMDGIELMQYLYENNPEIKIIILSGYNDVEYLNMAIKNRVTEYLLKPTDIDEFEALFHRLKKTLDEERDRKKELELLKISAMHSRELSYNRVLENLLEGYVGDEQEYGWKKELEEQGMNFGHCVLAVLYAVPEEKGEKDNHYRLQQRVIQYCNTRETPWKKRFFLHRDGNVVGMITWSGKKEAAKWMADKKAEEELEKIRQCVEEIRQETGEIYGLTLGSGISGWCLEEKELPGVYRKTLERITFDGSENGTDQNRKNGLVASICTYLDQEYCSNLVSLEGVAERFRKSPAYVSKVFKKETGFNFSDYITQKRMAKSKLLLRDMSLKIYEIAEMTGYADASNFIRVFKKHCGMSPNEYRGLIS